MSRSLLARSASGMLWLGGGQVSHQLLHLVSRLILARLLAPEAFGLVAMASVFLGFTQLIFDLGLGAALVQRPVIEERDRSTAFWSVGLVAAVLAIGLILAAPWVAAFYRTEGLILVLRALALGLPLAVPESVAGALLQRELNFRALGLRKIIATLVGGGSGIACALAGLGVWSLVVESLLRNAIGSILLLVQSRWLPRMLFCRQTLAQLWRFSRYITGARVVNFFNRNADNLLVGRYLGSADLGLYSVAYQAILVPLQYLARPMTAVGFPAFSTLRHDLDRSRHAFFEGLRLVVLLTWPVAALGVFASPAAVPLILGEVWAPVVPAFRILSLVAALHSAGNLSAALFDGLGRPDLGFKFLLFASALNVAGFAVGLRWGITGVAAGYLAANLIALPAHYLLVLRLIEAPAAPLLAIFVKGALAAAALGIAWELAAAFLTPRTDLLEFAACLLAAGAAYAAASYFLLHDAWRLGIQAFRQVATR